ncbi:hypothetical protein D6779_06355, partial [Candidatus Parcubacteria bacterium]
IAQQVAPFAGAVFSDDDARQVQVGVALAGVDDLRQAAGDVQGKVGGGCAHGLAHPVAEAVVDGLDHRRRMNC